MNIDLIRADGLLFWTFKPGAKLDTRTVNSMALLNKAVEIPKPKGTFRILCLGDSCTAIGPASYPQNLQKRLNMVNRPDRHFEVINAGCFGYTSHQGLLHFRDRLTDIEPDLVTVYYGWNDLYLTNGYCDNLLSSAARPHPLLDPLRELRIYQAMDKLLSFETATKNDRSLRVAPDDYKKNLSAIVELAAKRGSRVILLTAPSNHDERGVPIRFLMDGLAESGEILVYRRRQYNDIVREIAHDRGITLLDLANTFDRHRNERLFHEDGVHPNGSGRNLIADTLVEGLSITGVLTPQEKELIKERSAPDSM